MSKRLIGILLCIAAGLILTACGNKETVYQSQRHWTERTVPALKGALLRMLRKSPEELEQIRMAAKKKETHKGH